MINKGTAFIIKLMSLAILRFVLCPACNFYQSRRNKFRHHIFILCCLPQGTPRSRFYISYLSFSQSPLHFSPLFLSPLTFLPRSLSISPQDAFHKPSVLTALHSASGTSTSSFPTVHHCLLPHLCIKYQALWKGRVAEYDAGV